MIPERDTFRVAANFLIMRDNKVLLGRRINTGFGDGNYHAIGGHVEKNQTLTQTAVREAKEEVGITIAESDLQFAHVVHRGAEGGWLDFFFVVTKWVGEPTNCEPDKCDDLSWFTFDDLPSNIVPYTKHSIEQYQKGIPYSEFEWPER